MRGKFLIQFDVVKFFDFPDHHPYSEKDLAIRVQYAQNKNIPIITTEKDYVKLAYDTKHHIHTLKLSIELDDKLVDGIKQKLQLIH